MAQSEISEASRSVAQNAFYLLVAKAISTGLGFFLVLYLARSLGDINFGIYTLGIALGGIFIILADLGLNNLTIRHLARYHDTANIFLGKVVVLRLVLALPVLALAVAVLVVLQYAPLTRTVIIIMIASSLLLKSFTYFYIHIFEGFEKMQYITVMESIKKVTDLLVCIVILSMGYGLLALVVGLLFNDACNLILAWWLCRRKLGIHMRLQIAREEWGDLIKVALPFGLLLAFMNILTSTDVAMLSKIRTEQEVGWYGAAIRLTNTLTMIPLMGASAMFPTASRIFKEELSLVGKLYTAVMRPMVLMAVPIATGTTLLAHGIILLLFGNEYVPAADALGILIWSVALYFITLPMIWLLSAVDRQKYATVTMGISALLNIVVNLYLIPRYGIIGASITTVISQFVIFVFCITPITRLIGKIGLTRFCMQSIIGSGVMAVVIWLLQDLHVLVTIGIGAVIYILALVAIRAISLDDWRKFRQLSATG